jgi:methenyltetrahydrofolate cyclohydrolase
MSIPLNEQGEQLIVLPLYKLLEMFGAGEATPGAGSYAALVGMLACKLGLTVIKITREKRDYAVFSLQLNRIETRLENLEAGLRDAFQRDSDEWAYVIEVRRKRDREVKGSEKHGQLSEEARRLTEKATDVLIEIGAACIEVAECAIDLLNVGYSAVRGDSSAAASGGLDGAQTALATAYLNLKSFRDKREASVICRQCDTLREQLRSLQGELELKITELRADGLPPTKSEESAREALALAARDTSEKYAEKAQTRTLVATVKERGDIGQSNEDVFDEIFMKRKRGAWYRRIQDFFNLQGLGTFAANKGFLRYVKQTIDESRYRSVGKLTDDTLLKWYKTFKVREEREGSEL